MKLRMTCSLILLSFVFMSKAALDESRQKRYDNTAHVELAGYPDLAKVMIESKPFSQVWAQATTVSLRNSAMYLLMKNIQENLKGGKVNVNVLSQLHNFYDAQKSNLNAKLLDIERDKILKQDEENRQPDIENLVNEYAQ